MSKKAVLLVNLGSPESTSPKDVRKYLKQFLSDPRVLDSHPWVRALVLNCLILPTRPKKTAEAYSKIWKKEGSPLILTSQAVQSKLQALSNTPIELAMTYGNPSIPSAIQNLKAQGITELFVVPLYPHYAMSSYETAVVAVHNAIRKHAPHIKPTTLQPFYQDPEYIQALVESSKKYLAQDYDMLLFSYHGIPERHLRKSDPSHAHCLVQKNCCNTCNPAHATCYKHQCLQTTKHFVKLANIPETKYFVSFQSRLGRDPWLQPYTDKMLEEFPKKGIKKLLVICPAFVSDCLETLEEIAMEGKEEFLEAGGTSYHQIPCLNEHPAWINYLNNQINTFLNPPSTTCAQSLTSAA